MLSLYCSISLSISMDKAMSCSEKVLYRYMFELRTTRVVNILHLYFIVYDKNELGEEPVLPTKSYLLELVE